MRAVRMKVTAALLEDVLHMPHDMSVVGCLGSGPRDDDTVELIVESPAFDDVPAPKGAATRGEMYLALPEANPTMTKHQARLEWKLGDVALGDGRGRIP